jgi:hypothetical protein
VIHCRKFFGAPAGAAKPPPQQTKLAFSTKTSKKAESTEKEDVEPEVVEEEVTDGEKARSPSPKIESADEKETPNGGTGMLKVVTPGSRGLTD